MNSDSPQTWVNIAVAERETGVGKDTLRVWERRYGFPSPSRNENGDRLYSHSQITRLRLMKRLLDRGHRPGRVVNASDDTLRLLVEREGVAVQVDSAAAPSLMHAHALSSLRQQDAPDWRAYLSRQLTQVGLEKFVTETLPHLNEQVGDAWARGDLQVFEEHLYTEQVQNMLRLAINNLPDGTREPRVLLTTVPGERHVLGVLMVEALLALRGIRTLSLGAQTPLLDIAAAARAHGAQVVALSFSAAFPVRQLAPVLSELRGLLDASVRIWIGGAGTHRWNDRIKGVERMANLSDVLAVN
jgi:DNA-binding transcriptional MerR regulator/methylmalonyl-CoA mutase cobalamin-binding subunit